MGKTVLVRGRLSRTHAQAHIETTQIIAQKEEDDTYGDTTALPSLHAGESASQDPEVVRSTTTMETSLVRLSTFYGLVHTAGALCRLMSLSPLLGHVAAGAVLGPPLAKLAPSPDGLSLAGLAGVWLSVIDAGLTTDAAAAAAAAPRAVAIAVAGIAGPAAGAAAVVYARAALSPALDPSASTTARAAAAAGAALAPTSLGVVAHLLAEHEELGTTLGRLVALAAVVDDLLSLVLLAQVIALARGSAGPWPIARPAVLAAAFVVGLLLLAAALPVALRVAGRAVCPPWRPRAGLALMLAAATALTWAAAVADTSFLLAAYLTGIAFSSVREAGWSVVEPWGRSVAPLIPALLRLFFAATIGFSIDLGALLSRPAVAIGAALGFVGVFGKVLCGVCAPNPRQDGLAVGVAMLGRGEFGFLIATEARRLRLLDQDLYGAVIWGVLIPTVVAPLAFGPIYRFRKRKLDSTAQHDLPISSSSPALIASQQCGSNSAGDVDAVEDDGDETGAPKGRVPQAAGGEAF